MIYSFSLIFNKSISLALGTPFIKLFLFVGLIINFFGIGLIVSLIFKFVRNGLKGSPFLFLISKCKWGPLKLPVSPVYPITSPFLTGS